MNFDERQFGDYIDTFQMHNGQLVFHVFEGYLP